VNVGLVVKEINEQTKGFAGMRVPVVIRVDPGTRQFTLVVGRPPVAALLLKEVGKESGSGKSKTEVIGDVSLDAVRRIADAKGADLHGRSDEERINQVIGTCVSMGITVDGTDPRQLLKQRVAARGAR
jgi:large subunit ribosomal protein L11